MENLIKLIAAKIRKHKFTQKRHPLIQGLKKKIHAWLILFKKPRPTQLDV